SDGGRKILPRLTGLPKRRTAGLRRPFAFSAGRGSGDGGRHRGHRAVDRAVVGRDLHEGPVPPVDVARLAQVQGVGPAAGVGGGLHHVAVHLPHVGQRDRVAVEVGGRGRRGQRVVGPGRGGAEGDRGGGRLVGDRDVERVIHRGAELVGGPD